MMARRSPRLSPRPTLKERFALNLWRSRQRAGLSQEDLGSLVGLNRAAVSALERGLRLPRIDTIIKLAAGTKVSTCVLLEGLEWRPGHYVDGNLLCRGPCGWPGRERPKVTAADLRMQRAVLASVLREHPNMLTLPSLAGRVLASPRSLAGGVALARALRDLDNEGLVFSDGHLVQSSRAALHVKRLLGEG